MQKAVGGKANVAPRPITGRGAK